MKRKIGETLNHKRRPCMRSEKLDYLMYAWVSSKFFPVEKGISQENCIYSVLT